MTFLGRTSFVFALIVASVSPLSAQAQGTKVGVLNCALSPSIGFIIGGYQKMACRFTPDVPGMLEPYVGSIGTVGLDLGFTAGGALAWAVYAPTNRMMPGSLSGAYVGASGN